MEAGKCRRQSRGRRGECHPASSVSHSWHGFSVFIYPKSTPFDVSTFVTSYFPIGFPPIVYVGHCLWEKNWPMIAPEDIDFVSSSSADEEENDKSPRGRTATRCLRADPLPSRNRSWQSSQPSLHNQDRLRHTSTLPATTAPPLPRHPPTLLPAPPRLPHPAPPPRTWPPPTHLSPPPPHLNPHSPHPSTAPPPPTHIQPPPLQPAPAPCIPSSSPSHRPRPPSAPQPRRPCWPSCARRRRRWAGCRGRWGSSGRW